MHRRQMVVIAAVVLLVSGATTNAGRAQERRLPSEALHDVAKGRLDGSRRTPDQIEAALKPLLQNVQTASLSPEEEVALGLAYFFTFDGASAKPLFERHMARDDRFGRVSWQSLQQMSFFGAKDYVLVERRLAEFRQKFAPIPDDSEYTFHMVNNLARYYASQGNHAKAVGLILQDLEQLQLGIPFRSFDLPGLHFSSFQAEGKATTALDWIKRHRDALAATGSAASRGETPDSALSTPALDLPHRAGVYHLSPFADLLFPDNPGWTPESGNRARRARAIAKFNRWLPALERGESLPTS